MPRPKNDEQLRLFKRKLDGLELYYCALDEENKIITTWVTRTADERKAVKKALAILKSIPKTPLKNYKPKEKEALSLLEIKKIEALDWSNTRQKAALVLGFSCGLRMCEIRALRWKHVDLNNHVLSVIENFTDDNGMKDPKAVTLRLVPIFGTVFEILNELKRTNPYGGDGDDFVLPSVAKYKPLAAITIKRGFDKIMDAIGIDRDARTKRKLSFHSMRHFYVTRIRYIGLSEFSISAMTIFRTIPLRQ